jgi:hypothetical protein
MSPLMPGQSKGKSHLVGKEKRSAGKGCKRDTDLALSVVHLDGA